MKKVGRWLVLSGSISLLFLLASCDSHDKKAVPNQAVPVTVAKAELKPVELKLNSVGSLVSREQPMLRAEIAGIIRGINAHEGDTVTIGQLLVRISREKSQAALYESAAQLQSANAKLVQTKSVFDRYSELLQSKNISQVQYGQAQSEYLSAKAAYDSAQNANDNAIYNLFQTDIYSPINGQVLKIFVSVGETINPGDKVIQLVNHDQLEAHLPFSEDQINYLTTGKPVLLYSVTHPGEEITTTVSAVSAEIDANNRGVDVIAQFNNSHHWHAGASVSGELIAIEDQQSVLIPEESVVLQTGNKVAFVVENNIAYIRVLTLGFSIGGSVVVENGIKPGDMVVVRGASYLSDGSPVEILKD